MALQALLVVVLAAGGLAARAALVAARDEIVIEPRVERAALVEVERAVVVPVTLELEAFGSVEAAREAQLSAEVAGRIERIAVQAVEGGRVTAGQVLVELDRADLELARIAASAQVAEAQAALAQEEAEADMARVDLERAGVTDPGTLALREPQLARARASLASARAALEQAELDLGRTRIAAPFDALVTMEMVDVGQVVAPGTRLFELVAIDAFEVRLPLVARDRELLAPLGVGDVEGPEVTLVLDGRPDSPTWPSRIVRTLPALDGFSRALVAIAQVERPLEGPLPLRIGEFVRVTLPGRRISDAVVLPEAAVRAGDEVWLAGPDDRLVRRRVIVAQRMDGNAIVERGLEAGDRVIVSALEAAPEGLALDVSEARP